jgi:signal transduction histidine kinase
MRHATATDPTAPHRTPARPPLTLVERPVAVTPVMGSLDGGFFRDLIWHIQNGVVAIDREARLVAMNAVAYRILGLPASTGDVGRPIADVLDAHPELAGVLASAFEVEVLPDRAELRLEPLGRVFGYTMSHVRNQHGDVVGAALMFKDLTLVEQQEERDRLRDRLAALGEMAAAIAHEVKNPLAGIEVMAGVLRRQLAGQPDAQTALSEIIHEAKAANSIVVKVLEFVKPVRLQFEPVPVSTMLTDALASAERQTRRGEIDVRLEVAPGPRAVQGDSQLLHQLFTNLLSNAFEALEGRGTVVLAARTVVHGGRSLEDGSDSGALRVDVIDDGPGIATETLDHIFSPFFTTKAKGSGLGLAMVRKIVDAHGGRIEVLTSPGGGTCFRVLLPRNPDPEARSRHEA